MDIRYGTFRCGFDLDSKIPLVREGKRKYRPLYGYQELLNLSPHMGWGGYSPECDQLAFAILLDYIIKTEKVTPQEAYAKLDSRKVNGFSGKVISKLNSVYWELTGEEVGKFLEEMG